MNKEIKNRLEVEYHRGEIKDTPIINWRQALKDIQFLLSHISTLEDAIDKHETYKRTHRKVVRLEDEELYQTVEKIRKEAK